MILRTLIWIWTWMYLLSSRVDAYKGIKKLWPPVSPLGTQIGGSNDRTNYNGELIWTPEKKTSRVINMRTPKLSGLEHVDAMKTGRPATINNRSSHYLSYRERVTQQQRGDSSASKVKKKWRRSTKDQPIGIGKKESLHMQTSVAEMQDDGNRPMPNTTTTTEPPTFLPHVGQRNLHPMFDPSTPKNVTALVGKSAYLNCRVGNLANKTVSWIRHRDLHILTVGAYTYTSDQRFQATHDKETEDWTLQIKWVQKRDKGAYECQVSTQPVMSYFVNLDVVVPTAYIIGGPDLHVDKGSTINLTCSVKYSQEPPAYIFWFHQDEVISYDSLRGGVSVITEKAEVTISNLLIQNADLADSGKYSCSPSNADVASVRVHVLNANAIVSGENPEAMQTASVGQGVSLLCQMLSFGIALLQISRKFQSDISDV